MYFFEGEVFVTFVSIMEAHLEIEWVERALYICFHWVVVQLHEVMDLMLLVLLRLLRNQGKV